MPRPIPSPDWYKQCIDDLAGSVPPPQTVDNDGISDFRFREQTIQQALLLKAAKYVSGLNAGDVLIRRGFFHEVGILKRTLNEAGDDLLFLNLAMAHDNLTEDHQRFLKNFWKEVPTFEEFGTQKTRKDIVQRQIILEYLAQKVSGDDLEGSISSLKYITHVNSGFVHGASCHIMGIFDPQTEKLEVNGVRNQDLFLESEDDWENYHFMGIIHIVGAAKALKVESVLERARAMHKELVTHYT